ncbi:MAG: CAP domain-containing protein [Terracidiphilus sp.]|jgi:uncharacterized protein YkwD
MTFSTKTLLITIAAVAVFLPAQRALSAPASGASGADIQIGNSQALRNKAEQLFALANQVRAARGLNPLQWDPALAAAALNHCARMAAEGQISHQYPGEPGLGDRAGQAGAHFSLLEENVADGEQPAQIHQAWMNSQGHRDNLLNPAVDRLGVAVVARGSRLYAVEDFARGVQVLTMEQVEARVSNLMQQNGIAAHANSVGARLACEQDHGLPVSLDNRRPEFIMRWQDAELQRLPGALLDRIATGKYHEAAVGSCPSQDSTQTFTIYRVAVLLLKPQQGASQTYISSK